LRFAAVDALGKASTAELAVVTRERFMALICDCELKQQKLCGWSLDCRRNSLEGSTRTPQSILLAKICGQTDVAQVAAAPRCFVAPLFDTFARLG
jgi:hypothetical protein